LGRIKGVIMKILITGCQGFIGSNLVKHLLKQGHDVWGIDRGKSLVGGREILCKLIPHDMEDPLTIENDFDRIYHFGADVANSKTQGTTQMSTMRSNALQTINALDFAVKNKSYFIYPSSALIYNVDFQTYDKPLTPLNEKMIFPANCDKGYGWDKLYGLLMVQNYGKETGMPYSTPVFHAIYGPGLSLDYNSKVIGAMCKKILENDKELKIWGDGSQVRSFCYIDDLMKGLDLLIEKNINEPVNIGSSEAVTMTEVADMLLKISGKNLEKVYQPTEPTGCWKRSSDNTLIKTLTGWEPDTPLLEGLTRTFIWVKNNI
jgi:nucleoside-diphosphate-sugar epimerase|tara:strand:- start:6650 stop:7603 length:954 start_codon:yes stop_codon:yes gene_type:complete